MLRIIGKHGKAIETFVERDLLQPGSITINEEQVEVGTPRIRIVYIRSEDDLLAIRMEIGREICSAILSKLPLVAAIGSHDIDFKFYRHDKNLGEKVPIFVNFLWCLWSAWPPP